MQNVGQLFDWKIQNMAVKCIMGILFIWSKLVLILISHFENSEQDGEAYHGDFVLFWSKVVPVLISHVTIIPKVWHGFLIWSRSTTEKRCCGVNSTQNVPHAARPHQTLQSLPSTPAPGAGHRETGTPWMTDGYHSQSSQSLKLDTDWPTGRQRQAAIQAGRHTDKTGTDKQLMTSNPRSFTHLLSKKLFIKHIQLSFQLSWLFSHQCSWCHVCVPDQSVSWVHNSPVSVMHNNSLVSIMWALLINKCDA